MIKHLFAPGLAISTTLLLSAGQALAGSFFIDSFSDPLGSIDQFIEFGGGINSGTLTTPGLRPTQTLGGERTISGELVSGNDLIRAGEISVITEMPMMPRTGYFAVDNNLGANIKTSLRWDGSGMGLGSFVDKTGLDAALKLNFNEVNASTMFTVSLMDTAGRMVSLTKSGFTTDQLNLFTYKEFLATDMGIDFDFTSVKSAQLDIMSLAGVDTSINSFQGLELPEPSMIFGSLIALGLGFLTKKNSSDSE